MTMYQLVVTAEYNHCNGYIEKDTKTYYSSFVAHLLHKYEQFKQSKSCDYDINASVYKIKNIRTMTLDEIGVHIHNDDDFNFICSFKDCGAASF